MPGKGSLRDRVAPHSKPCCVTRSVAELDGEDQMFFGELERDWPNVRVKGATLARELGVHHDSVYKHMERRCTCYGETR